MCAAVTAFGYIHVPLIWTKIVSGRNSEIGTKLRRTCTCGTAGVTGGAPLSRKNPFDSQQGVI